VIKLSRKRKKTIDELIVEKQYILKELEVLYAQFENAEAYYAMYCMGEERDPQICEKIMEESNRIWREIQRLQKRLNEIEDILLFGVDT